MISFGLSRRATIFLFTFAAIFIASISISVFSDGNIFKNIIILPILLPLFLLDIFLGYMAFSPKYIEAFRTEEKIKKDQNIRNKKLLNTGLGRKAYVGMATHGVAVAIGILLMCLCLILDIEPKYLFILFLVYVLIGIPLIWYFLGPIIHKKIG